MVGSIECCPLVGFFKGDHGQTDKPTRVVEPLPMDGEGIAATDGLNWVGGISEDWGLRAFGFARAVASESRCYKALIGFFFKKSAR